MKIQFNTDVNINGTEALTTLAIATLEAELEHFEQHTSKKTSGLPLSAM